MADDPINELVDVIDLPPLPKLPEPFGAVEMADGSEALVYSADQLRQVQREAYEAGRASSAEKDRLLQNACFAIEAMLKHFTKTPSTLADSTARSIGHQATLAIDAHFKAGKENR